jgi:UDPglucose 6-dehydrogenase
MKIGVIGLGVVGGSLLTSFKCKELDVESYDKYKSVGTFESILSTDIVFLCLPTLFDENKKEYNKDAIHEICESLVKNNYIGIVVLKSTVEPSTTDNLAIKYNLKFVFNPEFLTSTRAFEDFHNQKHIVLGKSNMIIDEDMDVLESFYRSNYPDAKISKTTAINSESMKIFCNSFYSVKVQFFNELFLLCQKNNANYNEIVELMLKNGWINEMHTKVPGPDGQLSYGGACFPKDTNALLNYMIKNNSDCAVLKAVIDERNKFRSD